MRHNNAFMGECMSDKPVIGNLKKRWKLLLVHSLDC